MKPFTTGTDTRLRCVAFLTMCRWCLCSVHWVKIRPWCDIPLGAGGWYGGGISTPAYRRGSSATHQRVYPSPNRMQSLPGVRSGICMTGQRGQDKGAPRSMGMVKLVSCIKRHNHRGWGHVVEIRQIPMCVVSLSTTLRRYPTVGAVEFLRFKCHHTGSCGERP